MIRCKTGILLFCMLILILNGCSMREEAATISTGESAASGEMGDRAFSGRAEASETVRVVSKQPGKVLQVNVEVGSNVEKGQPMLLLDARELSANVEVARASLDNVEISYEAALANQKRAEVLQADGAIGLAEYENNYLSVLKKAEAAVDLARANLDKALVAYEDSIITAPISGTVAEVNAEPGEMVGSQSPCVVLVNLDEIAIKLYVDEMKINSLKTGQRYNVEFSAIPEKTFEGTISSISGAMDETAKGYPVNIIVQNPDQVIKDGMFAKVFL